MATKGGTITQRDLITDDALKFGDKLADQAKIAIDAFEDLKKSAKSMADIVNSYRKVDNQNAFLEVKRQEQIENIKALNSINQLKAADIAMQKVKQASIDTEKKALDLKQKTEKAQQNAINKTAEEIVNQRIRIREANNLALSNSKLASEYEKLGAKVKIAARNLQDIVIKGKLASETTSQYNERLRVAQNEFDKLQAKVIIANRAIGRFNDNVGNYPRQAVLALRELMEAFGLVAGIQTFVSITKQAFNIVREFEKEMVNLAAIAGFTRDEIAPLEAEIRRVAKASINSATDVAKLATELIKLGSTPEEAMKLIEPINNLSIALKATAEDSATLVKSLLNAYGEGAEKAAHYTDVLAESANRSALDFQGLRDAFSYVAPVAKTLGISVEKTAALIGTLADNGIKAESAGRLLGTGLGKIASQGLTLEQALKKITDAQDEGKSSLDVLNTANNLFGVEAGKLALILANNKIKIDESTVAYENSNGALKELTEKQLKSLNSELEILSSAWEEYILNANEANGGTQVLTTTVRFFSDNLSTIVNVLLLATAGFLSYKAAIIVANIQTRLLALSTQASAAAQIEGAVATNVATVAFEKFNATLKRNALGLILAGLIFFIATMDAYGKTATETAEENNKLTDSFLKNRDIAAKNASSIKTLSDRYDELKGKTSLSKDEQNELNEIIKVLAKTVPDAVTEVDKYGNALALSTKKTKEFIVRNNELYKQINQTKLSEAKENIIALREEQKRLTLANLEFFDGLGKLVKEDGRVKRSTLYGTKELTSAELELYSKRVAGNEKAISDTERLIKALSGVTEVQKKAAAAAAAKAAEEQKNAPRTIELIDEEIKAEKDKIAQLTLSTKAQGPMIDARIKALEAERDAIYNNDKADKVKTDNGLKNSKQIIDAIHQLNQFRYDDEIETNQKIADDEKRLIDDRLDALYTVEKAKQLKSEESLRFELEKNALEKVDLDKLSKEKFEIYKKDSRNRIELLLAGKIANQNMTNEEKLLLEKFFSDKKGLEAQSVKDKIKLEEEEAKRLDTEFKRRFENLKNYEVEANNIADSQIINLDKQLRSGKLSQQQYEDELLKIKNNAAKASLENQLDGLKDELIALATTTEQKEVIEQQFHNLKKQLNDQETKEFLELQGKIAKKRNDSITESSRLIAEAFKTDGNNLEIFFKQVFSMFDKLLKGGEFTVEDFKESVAAAMAVVGDISNAITETKIANIDVEIQKNNEFYEKQILLAGEDQRKKDLLQKQQQKKNDELEKKKRAEQNKQAVFNKALAITQASINLGLAVTAALATTPPASFALAAITAALAGVALATVIATPIPKYAGGRKGGPEELAIINDGGVTEVVSNADGSNPRMHKNRNALVHLLEGDIVHKSENDYKKYMRASMHDSLTIEHQKIIAYQNAVGNDLYGNEMLQELRYNTKAITEAIKKQKQTIIVNSPKIDIGHELWKLGNTNWNR